MSHAIFVTGSINIAACLVMALMASLNHVLPPKWRHGFARIFIMIGLITVSEMIAILLVGRADRIVVQVLANMLGFAFTALLPVMVGDLVSENRISRPFYTITGIYFLMLMQSQSLKLVFYVDPRGYYQRCDGYWTFLLVLGINLVYMGVSTARFSQQFQSRSRPVFAAMLALMVLGTGAQAVLPSVRVSWSCITILACIYYTYCCEHWQQTDDLTGLLNHGCFLRELSDPRRDYVLLVFDVDRFKQINDSFGHRYGDRCLVAVAQSIEKVYRRFGGCYRIGGDEFAAILYRAGGQDLNGLFDRFQEDLERKRDMLEHLPTVSMGYAVGSRRVNALTAMDEADQMMYRSKLRRYGANVPRAQ